MKHSWLNSYSSLFSHNQLVGVLYSDFRTFFSLYPFSLPTLGLDFHWLLCALISRIANWSSSLFFLYILTYLTHQSQITMLGTQTKLGLHVWIRHCHYFNSIIVYLNNSLKEKEKENLVLCKYNIILWEIARQTQIDI